MPDAEFYNTKTVVGLRTLCRERGIPYAKLSKAAMTEALAAADAEAEAPEEASGSEAPESGEEALSSPEGSEEEEEEGDESEAASEEDEGGESEEEESEEVPIVMPVEKKKPSPGKAKPAKPSPAKSSGSTKPTKPKGSKGSKEPAAKPSPSKPTKPKEVTPPKKTKEVAAKPNKPAEKPTKPSPPKKTKEVAKPPKKVSSPKPKPAEVVAESELAEAPLVQVSDVKGAVEVVKARLDTFGKRSDSEYRRLAQILNNTRAEAYRDVFENFLVPDSMRECLAHLSVNISTSLKNLVKLILDEVMVAFLSHSRITYQPSIGAFVDRGYAYQVGDKALIFGKVVGNSVVPLTAKDMAGISKSELWHEENHKPVPDAKTIAKLISDTIPPIETPEGSEEGEETPDAKAEEAVDEELAAISRPAPGRKEYVAYVKAQKALPSPAKADYRAIAEKAGLPEATARYIATNFPRMKKRYAVKK